MNENTEGKLHNLKQPVARSDTYGPEVFPRDDYRKGCSHGQKDT